MSGGLSESLPSLAGCEWLERQETQEIFDALLAAGGEARAVGGAVRNSLLGEPVKDIDIATTLTPQAVMDAAEKAGLKAIPTGVEHGTVTLIAEHHPFEITTLREDVKTFGRHAEVVFSKDWAADAARRDFTINALYADSRGTLYDPLGGYPDLTAQRIRFIGDADQRIKEDYLRILRFFRFNAEYGQDGIDGVGLSACVRERAGLAGLSAERVRAEFLRLLCARRALQMIETMFDYGLLVDILGTAPALTRLEKLIEAEALANFSPDPVRRLGALSVRVTEDAERMGERLRLSKAEKRRLMALTVRCEFVHYEMSERDGRAALYRLGEETFQDVMLLKWAERGDSATNEFEHWRSLLRLPTRWQTPEFPLSGHDAHAAGLSQGRDVGMALDAVERWWVEHDFSADESELKGRLQLEAQRLNNS